MESPPAEFSVVRIVKLSCFGVLFCLAMTHFLDGRISHDDEPYLLVAVVSLWGAVGVVNPTAMRWLKIALIVGVVAVILFFVFLFIVFATGDPIQN
ncbi:MAG: hypothetical protein JNL96_16940 [Planctomycetaceae bacterium]|nr:hypothetical protein [Planctomycetaceae bacterium]